MNKAYAICIESSHERGMGHLFRALNVCRYLRQTGDGYVVLMNHDEVSERILDANDILNETVDYLDESSNWERNMIRKYQTNVWIMDKFNSNVNLCSHVKDEGVLLVGIDDCGEGAALFDVHFCCLLFQEKRGRHIFAGKDYLVLNPDIARYRRARSNLNKIMVTLGGSDTYGVTIRVIKALIWAGIAADVVIGPNFQHREELKNIINENYKIYDSVDSMIAFMSGYDLAITGGGVTCIEANASGLPCIIIANETHEIDIGKWVASFGGSQFAGYYSVIDEDVFKDIEQLEMNAMSQKAMGAFELNGVGRMFEVIKSFESKGV